jgi:MFS family permease
MIEKLLLLKSNSTDDSAVLRHNLRVHIGDGSIFAFAMSLVAVTTIMPVLLQQLGAGALAIGAVPVFWTLGLNMPQAIYMHMARPKTSVKYRMVLYGILHRFFFFVIGVVTFLLGSGPYAHYAVPMVLLCFICAAVTGSLGGLHWFHLYAATTPVHLRGRLSALRQLLGSLMGVIGGSLVTIILGAVYFPLNFSILYIFASALMMGSVTILSRLVVPASVLETPRQEVKRNIIAEGRRILRADKNFKSYLVADALMLMSMTASAFYAVHAIEKYSLSASYAGSFTVIVMVSTVIGNIFFGILADHLGNKVNLLALAVTSAAASFCAIWAGNVLAYGLVFIFMASSIGLQGISRLSFIAELCSETDRPVYVALANTLTAPTVFIGIIFGGLVPALGYDIIFFIAGMLGAAAFAVLWYRVVDPRHIVTVKRNPIV